MSLVFQSI